MSIKKFCKSAFLFIIWLFSEALLGLSIVGIVDFSGYHAFVPSDLSLDEASSLFAFLACFAAFVINFIFMLGIQSHSFDLYYTWSNVFLIYPFLTYFYDLEFGAGAEWMKITRILVILGLAVKAIILCITMYQVSENWIAGAGCLQHRWNKGCVCVRCGKKRDQGHDWDGCQCKICGKKRDQGHDWDGCQCKRCGKKRDQEHDWDGCQCKRCGKKRDQEHDWDGCKCRRCGKTRDQEHDLDGCKCRRCGAVRHNLVGCKCKRCGAEQHDWDGCQCKRCGVVHHDWEYWPGVNTCEGSWVCSKCGKTIGEFDGFDDDSDY